MKVLSAETYPEKQMQREIVSYCRQALKNGSSKRNGIRTPEEWKTLREEYMKVIRNAFPEIIFEKNRSLNSRVISSYEFEDYKIENVIFESLPGWEVNGTVYLPKKPGLYPGVICPTGHSSKVFRNYQRSAQTIARSGYVVISFDPPGCSGEKQYMNDHFTNGVIGYLTGFWSMTHFVADALRAVDYLETRIDVDKNAGFSMTGVSGGGLTSIFSAILDERIKFCAPVCCLSEHERIHLNDLYTSCPEQFGPGFIAAGMDYSDYLCLLAPKFCLAVAGKKDEVFDCKGTSKIVDDAAHIYALTGYRGNLRLYIDEDADHAYTVKMANEVVFWMDKMIKGSVITSSVLKEEDVLDAEHEKLKCNPRNDVNMFTINRKEALRLKRLRQLPVDTEERKMVLCNRAKFVLGISEDDCLQTAEAKEHEPQLRWFHYLQKISLRLNSGVLIPGLMLKRDGISGRRPALLFIDENGKWESFKQGGFLTRTGRFLESELCEDEPLVLSIDVTGFGELIPEPTAYDLAEWNDIERILTYISIAAGKPVMGLRVRDALSVLNYLASRSDVDPDRIMIGGKGIGAIVALHAALIWGRVSKVLLFDMLSHYGALTDSSPFKWNQSIIIPGILEQYDLPDIVNCLGERNVYVTNLLDEQKCTIPSQQE